MTELGSTADPTALIPGSPDGASAMTAAWQAAAQSASRLSESVFAVSPADSWTGSSAEAFEYRRTTVADTWAAISDALAMGASACAGYETTLRWAQRQAADAIRLWTDGQVSTREAQAVHREQVRTAGGLSFVTDFVDPGEAQRDAARDLLQQARESVRAAAFEAEAQLRIAEELTPQPGLWGLVLVGTPAPAMTAATPKAVSDRLMMSLLRRLGRADGEQVRELLDLHPEWAQLLRNHPPAPALVSAWWGEQSAEAQNALLESAPAIMGSLGGLPPLVRVAANRANAASRIRDIDAELNAPSSAETDREALEQERAYLERAVNGKVQLYLYEPAERSIVEMVGTPSDSTRATLTYVPGTFTTVDSFFGSNGVQSVARWMNQNDPDIVGFVWKEGVFPGEGATPAIGSGALLGLPGAAGIMEANDPGLASEQAALLADFESEMRTSDPRLARAEQIAMGHSWGLVPITGSEGAGAHYDQVHSLAGAGMPPGWVADPHTSYNHWGYRDALSMAQELGVVWDGHNPATDAAFDSQVYSRDGDFELPIGDPTVPQVYGAGPGQPSLNATFSPVENHNLIASDRLENQQVLEDILRKVEK